MKFNNINISALALSCVLLFGCGGKGDHHSNNSNDLYQNGIKKSNKKNDNFLQAFNNGETAKVKLNLVPSSTKLEGFYSIQVQQESLKGKFSVEKQSGFLVNNWKLGNQRKEDVKGGKLSTWFKQYANQFGANQIFFEGTLKGFDLNGTKRVGSNVAAPTILPQYSLKTVYPNIQNPNTLQKFVDITISTACAAVAL